MNHRNHSSVNLTANLCADVSAGREWPSAFLPMEQVLVHADAACRVAASAVAHDEESVADERTVGASTPDAASVLDGVRTSTPSNSHVADLAPAGDAPELLALPERDLLSRTDDRASPGSSCR